MRLINWVAFYEMIYHELDEVERPIDKVINDDKRFDAWYSNYRGVMRDKLVKAHAKDPVSSNKPMPKPGRIAKSAKEPKK